ncbi:hypothetical protein KY284_031639 [Solanum tuberosum]|nr:hypothetical protein KY284_031639 [Solanum tuberosum]
MNGWRRHLEKTLQIEKSIEKRHQDGKTNTSNNQGSSMQTPDNVHSIPNKLKDKGFEKNPIEVEEESQDHTKTPHGSNHNSSAIRATKHITMPRGENKQLVKA